MGMKLLSPGAKGNVCSNRCEAIYCDLGCHKTHHCLASLHIASRFSLRQPLTTAHCRVQILGFHTYMHTKTGNAKVDTTIRTTCLFGANGKSLVPPEAARRISPHVLLLSRDAVVWVESPLKSFSFERPVETMCRSEMLPQGNPSSPLPVSRSSGFAVE